MVDFLFYRKTLRDFLEQKKGDLVSEINDADPNYILNVSEDDCSEYLVSKYSFESPVLREGEIYAHEPTDIDIDVSKDPNRFISDRARPFHVKGVSVTISIPFNGNSELFYYQPSTFTLSPPNGKVVGQELHLIYKMVEHNVEELKRAYQRDVDDIKKYLQWVNQDADAFNSWLKSSVKEIIAKRKKKLLDDLGLVSALGIPIKHSASLPQTYAIATVRKELKIERPKVTTGQFKPEPILPEEEYEYILGVIQNMALLMERSPKTFSKLSEEEIRDHFLLILNSHYEGQATGETFNYGGKTDILIRADDKNVFIAECKFWDGEKAFLETIDQLVGYISWRDRKNAILLFNKNQDFSSVLKKIDPAIKLHSCYKREYILKSSKLKNETTFSYVFHQPNDTNRELILTIMAFNVP